MSQPDGPLGDVTLELPDPRLCIVGADDRPMVTIDLVERSDAFGPGYRPDEAARIFWETVAGWRGVAVR